MSATPRDRFARIDQLAAGWCDGNLDATEQAELAQLITRDAALRRRYILHVQLHAAAETGIDVPAGAEPAPSLTSASRRRGWRSWLVDRPRPLSLSVATIAMGLLITAMSLIAVPVYRRFVASTAPVVEFVAELHGAHEAQWAVGQIGARPGSKLQAGQRLELVAGLADVYFRSGASVMLQGPTTLTIDGRGRATLHRGRLTCLVTPPARGFTIDTPTARLVDVGTEFGVKVDSDDACEVAVFRGAVEAHPARVNAEPRAARLIRAGQSWRVDAMGRMTASPNTAAQFARRDALPFHLRSDLDVLPVASYAYVNANFGEDPCCIWPDTLDDGRELTNGRLGRLDFTDPEWVGFANGVDDGQPQPLVIFDLGAPSLLHGITVSYMHSAGIAQVLAAGTITAPEEVQISYSDDGVEFSPPQSFTAFDHSPGSARRTARIAVPSVHARYVRFDFRQSSQWLFLTEVLLHGERAAPAATTDEVVKENRE